MLFRLLILFVVVSLWSGLADAQPPEFEPGDSFDTESDLGLERGPREGEERDRNGRRGPPPNPMFEAIDADGDGVLTKRELRKAAAALKTLDADGDGNVTMQEVTPPRGPRRGGPGGPGEDPAEAIERIMQHDADGDGLLTVKEVPEHVARMLSGADTNGDGAINRQELTQALENNREQFRGRGRQGGNGGAGGPLGRGGFGNDDQDTLLKQLMAGDQDNDGRLSPQEVPERMMGMLRGADKNGDGKLDAGEVRKAMIKARERRLKLRDRFGGQE